MRFDATPQVLQDESPLVRVGGTFFRAVDPDFAADALSGSRLDGRYSRAGTPTLYLSSSPQGVAAAMKKHVGDRSSDLDVLSFAVEAAAIADLRDVEAMRRIGVEPADALGDWQAEIRAGQTPKSWEVRSRMEAAGAKGLIDPSRKQPGLWHLTLFAWNEPGAATVSPL